MIVTMTMMIAMMVMILVMAMMVTMTMVMGMMRVMTNGKIMICHQEPTINNLLVKPEALSFFKRHFLFYSHLAKSRFRLEEISQM